MTNRNRACDNSDAHTRAVPRTPSRKLPTRRLLLALTSTGVLALTAAAAGIWLGGKATTVSEELSAASSLIPALKEEITGDRPDTAAATVEQLRGHTALAHKAVNDPVWTMATSLPMIGSNFSAVAEVARSADDVANLGLVPLVKVYGSLDWKTLLPSSTGSDLSQVESAAPSVAGAARAVRLSSDRMNQIDASSLIPQVSEPLTRARDQLQEVTGALDAAASAAKIVPGMLGASTPRNYLLMVQNNAETRASGGIPGALAVLNFSSGKLALSAQGNATDLGALEPSLLVDPEQQQIYTGRLGKYMQDVNLTPDFPTAASTAQAMWERKLGQRVDGVISIDPVALSYILDATGPIKISRPELLELAARGLPTELNGQNIVKTLLSDVYAKIQQPKLQDAYFAGVAQETFAALSNGKGEAEGLIKGLSKGVEEGRVLVWSANAAEQSVIADYAVSGSISGPSVAPAQYGVYFNDGTGAKMDYYVKRTVQLIKECPEDGYEETTLRVTSTNTAPANAATTLPAYVTGAGAFGVTPGNVQTNIVAYGPAQSNIQSVALDGQKTAFAPYVHANRPVGVVAEQLAPGESKTMEFTFGKIVQHTEPNVVVTPTVQPVNDVILPTKRESCGDGK